MGDLYDEGSIYDRVHEEHLVTMVVTPERSCHSCTHMSDSPSISRFRRRSVDRATSVLDLGWPPLAPTKTPRRGTFQAPLLHFQTEQATKQIRRHFIRYFGQQPYWDSYAPTLVGATTAYRNRIRQGPRKKRRADCGREVEFVCALYCMAVESVAVTAHHWCAPLYVEHTIFVS